MLAIQHIINPSNAIVAEMHHVTNVTHYQSNCYYCFLNSVFLFALINPKIEWTI